MDLQETSPDVLTDAEVLAINGDRATAIAAASPQAILFQNPIAPSRLTLGADLTECDFGGYARVDISAFTSPKLDQNGAAYSVDVSVEVFACDGGTPNTVYGSALLITNAGGVQATATNAGSAGNYSPAFAITNGGSGYDIVPRVRLTGATGAGATATAVLTGGVVTGITLVNPGNGAYTTYAVAIDPPQTLVQVGLYAAPIPIALPTDAIAQVTQYITPPISNS